MKKLLLLLFFGMIFLAGLVSSALTDGLVAHYGLDEASGTLYDDSASGQNLDKQQGTPLYSRTGIIGTAVGSNSANDRFINDNSNNLTNMYFGTTEDFSFNWWVRVNVFGSEVQMWTTNALVDPRAQAVLNPNGTMYVAIFTYALQTSFNVSNGSYHMITWLRNNSGQNDFLYVDNVLRVFNTSHTTQNASAQNFSIGDSQDGLTLNADIDLFGAWNRTLTASEISNLYNNGSGLDYPFTLTPTIISVTLNSPTNNSQITTNFTIYNATVTPNTFNLTNATLHIWFSNGTRYNVTTNSLTGNTANTTTFNVSLPFPATYLWNVRGVQGNSNGTNSSFATNNFTIRYSLVATNQLFVNATNYETARDNYVVNITTNGTTPTNAFLVYNNSIVNSATIISLGNNFYNISSTIDIPIGISNNSFYFNFTFAGLLTTTDIGYQNVLVTNFTMRSNTTCDAGSLPYLNFTFANENNLSVLNGVNDATTIYYWLGDGSVYKTLTTSNTTLNPFYAFCLAPQNRTLTTNLSFQYSSTDYPARTYVRNLLSLTSSPTNTTLYLLNSADGIYTTFQVVNSADQVLSGVTSNLTRTISGSTVIIGAGTTGSDGLITYWLDPDNLYTANFFHSSYPFFTTTQQFTQTSYTITLGQAEEEDVFNYQQGITYTILPSRLISLNNDTVYNFNFSLTSTYWVIERFGFNITDNNGNYFGSVSNTSNGGLVSLNVNTSLNSSLIMNAYWTINSTNTTITTSWLILDLSGNSFSIKRLVDDFVNFVGTGLFGLTNFGVGIILFLIIVTTTGVLKLRVGISNTATILGVMWALVAFFDVSVGLIPNPVNAIPHAPTILMGIIFGAITLKETIQ